MFDCALAVWSRLRKIATEKGNLWQVGSILLFAAAFGGLLDLLRLEGLLKFVWGLFFLNYGVFLRDVAQATSHGQTLLPCYPGGLDIWGVALPSVGFGLLGAVHWVLVFLVERPAAALASGMSCGAILVLCSLSTLGLPSRRERGAVWILSAAALFIWGAGSSFLLFELRRQALLFACTSVLVPLVSVLFASAVAHETA